MRFEAVAPAVSRGCVLVSTSMSDTGIIAYCDYCLDIHPSLQTRGILPRQKLACDTKSNAALLFGSSGVSYS